MSSYKWFVCLGMSVCLALPCVGLTREFHGTVITTAEQTMHLTVTKNATIGATCKAVSFEGGGPGIIGISFSDLSGLSSYAALSKVSSYAALAGQATTAAYASLVAQATIASYANLSGIASYTALSGLATTIVSGGNINTTGVISSSAFFVGADPGVSTTETVIGSGVTYVITYEKGLMTGFTAH